MSTQDLTISQAARTLNVSPRTIRRFIKSGKITAKLVPGPFGEEYRILALPTDLRKSRPVDKSPDQTPVPALDIIKDLQEKNLALAAQLGVATERIRNLESQMKLLTAPKPRPWWQRIFRQISSSRP